MNNYHVTVSKLFKNRFGNIDDNGMKQLVKMLRQVDWEAGVTLELNRIDLEKKLQKKIRYFSPNKLLLNT